MDVSYKKATAVPRRWALLLYLTLVSLMFLGILTQGFLIGALLFAGADWAGDAHAIGGLVVLILALLLPLAGQADHLERRAVRAYADSGDPAQSQRQRAIRGGAPSAQRHAAVWPDAAAAYPGLASAAAGHVIY